MAKLMRTIFKKIEGRFFPAASVDSARPLYWLRDFDVDSIIDIGSNEGQFAQTIRRVFPETNLFCFEPLKQPHDILHNKMSLLGSIRIFQCALGQADGQAEMHHCQFSPSSSLLEMDKLHKDAFPNTVNSVKETVLIRRLDSIPSIRTECQKPFIKVDTQGYEMNVILGGIETFRRAPIIMIEVSYYMLYKNQPLFDEIYGKLKDLGFYFAGNVDQLNDPSTSKPLQADAIFINKQYES